MFTVTIEVCLKPSNEAVDIWQLERALTLFIKSHNSNLTENTYISLDDIKYVSTLSNDMISKLLVADSTSTLEITPINAEIIISAHVERLYVAQFHSDLQRFVSLDQILQGLEGVNEIEIVLEKPEAPSLDNFDNASFQFILYKNTDTFPSQRNSISEGGKSSIIDNFDGVTLCPSFQNPGLEIHSLTDIFAEQLELKYINESIKYQTNPNSKYDSLWNDLKFDPLIQNQILNQISQSLYLENSNDRNNLFLFHGPPGSGKSTLCRAIAQKLSIYHQFSSLSQSSTLILEISSEKIFSKWYGESSQNLIKLFQILSKIIEYYTSSIIVLIIDEIETLANSRSQILSKNETSDGVRIVNTLLTQLDFLKKYPNYVILATSNLIESIDNAFLDRTDGCFFIDKPSVEAKFEILNQRIDELHQNHVIEWDSSNEMSKSIIYKLCVLCDKELDMSGRAINKLPHTAVSRVIRAQALKSSKPVKISTNLFLGTLSNIILEKIKSMK